MDDQVTLRLSFEPTLFGDQARRRHGAQLLGGAKARLSRQELTRSESKRFESLRWQPEAC